MKNTRDVLVIDDEPVVVQGVVRVCLSEGLSIDTAADGHSGLILLERNHYRLVLCDIMMEGYNGFDFLAELGRRPSPPPVVMTTGYSTVGNALRSLQCGAVDYLTKPFTADELMAVVQRALEHASVCTSLPSAQPTGGPCAENFYRLGLVSWVRTEPSGTALIGVHETFARTLKGIRKLQLLPEGTLLVQGTYCATIISSEGREHGVLCPLSGQVLEAQAAVSSTPALLENDPGGAGWLYRVIPTNLENGLRNLSSPLGTCKPHEVSRIGETL